MVKQIPLTQGKFALVDDEDYAFLRQWDWFYKADSSNGGYAVRTQHVMPIKRIDGTKIKQKSKTIRMHILINKTPKGMMTDHCGGWKEDKFGCL